MLIESIIFIYSLFGVNDSAAAAPAIYLCLDSMMSISKFDGKSPPKLVYGYINGKKTECMSEHELRARFSEVEFNQQKTAQPDSQKLLETSGKKRNARILKLKDAVYKGKKDLAGVDLRGCDLKGVDLSGADLHNANLESADLRNANLCNANLRGTSLEFAYLKDANLKNADITNARLKGTYLQYANLSGVEGLTLEHIRVVTSVYNTIFDSEMMEMVKEYCPNKLKDPGWQWRPTVFETDSVIPDKERVNSKKFR
ncbi:MAG TPA: pentapeptide repeat-containing protein [Chitinispirillaceae bacterium]|nr:pentapeptide repeat-containing protein [Chitinispirillaceae bacterium]